MFVCSASKQLLGDIKTQISQVTSHIPLSELTKVLDTLDQVQTDIGQANPLVERAENIR